jgi:CheY-like chemotaxis protein
MAKPNQDLSKTSIAPDHAAVMDAMDEAAEAAAGHDPSPRAKKRSRRMSYRQQINCSIQHPGGGIATFAVSSRNLSQGGMAFLCNAFIHPGSQCTMALVTPQRQQVTAVGKIVHCHLVRGRIHEIGVKFNRPINLGSFIAADVIPQSQVVPAELQGRLVLLNDSPLEEMLFRQSIQETKIQLATFRDSGAAIEALSTGQHDIFVNNVYLDSEADDGIAVITEARTKGFSGPIVLMTAETSADRQAEARAAGVNYFLARPYQALALLSLLQSALQDCGATVSPDLLVGTRSRQTEVTGLMGAFKEEVGQRAGEIQKGLTNNEAAILRRACMAVKAAATGVGYVNLANAADAALTSLAANPIPVARANVLRVASACRVLAQTQVQAA